MNKPYIDDLITKVDSRYTLVVSAAKRARQITDENPELSKAGMLNPVSKALKEIYAGEVVWARNDE